MTRQGRPPAVPKSSELPLQQQHCRCCYIINYIDMTITMIHMIKIGYIPYTMFRCMGLNYPNEMGSFQISLPASYYASMLLSGPNTSFISVVLRQIGQLGSRTQLSAPKTWTATVNLPITCI